MADILIVGGGAASRRYVRALSPEHYITLCSFGIKRQTEALALMESLPCIPYTALSRKLLERFDCVAVCVPIEAKYPVASRLLSLGYTGALILEKPLALTAEEGRRFARLLHGLDRYCVAYWRDYLPAAHVDLIENGCCMLEYASIFPDMKRNLTHNLPHALSWIARNGIDLAQLRLTEVRGDSIRGAAGALSLNITFTHPKEPIFKANGRTLPVFDYREAYQRLLASVLTSRREDSENILRKSLQISRIQEEALSLYEHSRAEISLQPGCDLQNGARE